MSQADNIKLLKEVVAELAQLSSARACSQATQESIDALGRKIAHVRFVDDQVAVDDIDAENRLDGGIALIRQHIPFADLLKAKQAYDQLVLNGLVSLSLGETGFYFTALITPIASMIEEQLQEELNRLTYQTYQEELARLNADFNQEEKQKEKQKELVRLQADFKIECEKYLTALKTSWLPTGRQEKIKHVTALMTELNNPNAQEAISRFYVIYTSKISVLEASRDPLALKFIKAIGILFLRVASLFAKDTANKLENKIRQTRGRLFGAAIGKAAQRKPEAEPLLESCRENFEIEESDSNHSSKSPSPRSSFSRRSSKES